MLAGKTIVLGVAGGIAAFKAASLASALTKAGADVHVIMTASAQKFITPLTFQALTKNHVLIDTFTEPDPSELAHIAIADKADLLVVAPTTANVVGKVAHGIADDMLTTTILATKAPVLFALAMNVNMFENAIVQDNIDYLKAKGYRFAEPQDGLLACGWTGKGRLMEPDDLVTLIEHFFAPAHPQDLAGVRLIVTAGNNVEPLDPVRLLTNRATGKMGYAIAEAAALRGAHVTLVTGPAHLTPHPAVADVVQIQTGLQMYDATVTRFDDCDVLIGAAAVSDYRPKDVHTQKLKKQDGPLLVEFVRNPDILAECGRRKRADQVLVGFAAETEQVLENARGKRERKNADFFVANDVTQELAGFGTDTNIVTFVTATGDEPLPLLSKLEVAHAILDRVVALRREKELA